ncbi:MAG TPA: glycine cleavage system aminomethyltransferase GcvT [Gemmatimonadales bacterium]|nr:glycine cleavage system aminomethyltransferase GcvT [Gemmatimonadales bacterium]
MSDQPLKRTPFFDLHVAAGAKLVPFAGFEMPVQYPSGITAEHRAVRQAAGLFDVSHMGEFEISGKDAVAFTSFVTSNDPAALAVGQVQYSALLHESGGIVDDVLVYRFADRVMLVVNASNIAKDWAHISRFAGRFDVKLRDISDEVALLALQGPQAEAALQPLCPDVQLAPLGYYRFTEGKVAGVQCIISRTGYTGEDGFELYHAPADAKRLWDALLGRPGVQLAGLGARDSLRLEVGYALYGNDIDDTTTPLEAGLNWIVKLKKDDFVGKAALLEQQQAGLKRKLVGFRLTEKGFPRQHMPVVIGAAGETYGEVRSGTVSPMTGEAIGTCYLPIEMTGIGTKFAIDIRGRLTGAEVVETPFWKHGTRKG